MTTNFLTLGIITRDSARYIERLLRQARLYADYVTVWVDDRSADGTPEIVRPLVNEMRLVSVPDYIEPVLNDLYDTCRTEWMLRLDDDELMAESFVQWHEALMQLPAACVWLPRYNLLGDEHTYLSKAPYCPDYQARLFRRGHVRVPRHIHSAPEITGKMIWTEQCHIFHMKLLLHTQAELDSCAQRYEQFAGLPVVGRFIWPSGPTAACIENIAR